MKRVTRICLVLTMALLVAAPLLGADKEKKAKKPARKPDPAAAVLKKLENADLTEEQVGKIKELAAKVQEKVAAAQAKAALTDEQKAARRDAVAKAKADGKSGKEAADAVAAALKLSPEQQQAMDEAKAANAGMMKEVLALLTPEQREKAGIKAKGKAKKGDKKPGKKKKPADE